MQQNNEVIEALREDLSELTALHAPSGSEQSVIARLYDLFTPLVDEVNIDHIGNLSATREGPPGAPHVVISAHADEVGAIVASIEPDGFLRLLPLGGVQSRLWEGRAVWVGGHPGVIGARSGHLTPHLERNRAASIEELFVDLGVDDAAGIAELGIRIGDPVVIISELRSLFGTRVSGKGIDNRASCVVLLHLLRHFYQHPLPCRLTALVTVQEEIGMRGATIAFTRLQPDLAIVIDTSPAADTPDTRQYPSKARIGGGVLITPSSRTETGGFLLPRAAYDILIATAQRANIAYQLALTNGGTTDASVAHKVAGGIPTLEVKIPRRYSHTPVELLDLRDLAATLTLVKELILHPPTTEDLAFLGKKK